MKDKTIYLVFLVHKFNDWRDGNGISMKLAMTDKKNEMIQIFEPSLVLFGGFEKITFGDYLFPIPIQEAKERIRVIKALPEIDKMLRNKHKRKLKEPFTNRTNKACHKIAVNWLDKYFPKKKA